MAPRTSDTFWTKKWPLVTAAVVVTSAVWGFFFVKILDLKDQQLGLLKSERDRLEKFGPTPDAIAKLSKSFEDLERRIIPLSLGFPADRLTGEISIGNAARTTTELTKALGEAQNSIGAKKFDEADSRIKDAEAMFPGFPGAFYLRFELERAKENWREAEDFADKLIAVLPTETRILNAFEFSIRAKLQRGEKRKAEELALRAIAIDPKKGAWRDFFQESFGYLPAMLREANQPNKAPEPTPGAVTPRATEGTSK